MTSVQRTITLPEKLDRSIMEIAKCNEESLSLTIQNLLRIGKDIPHGFSHAFETLALIKKNVPVKIEDLEKPYRKVISIDIKLLKLNSLVITGRDKQGELYIYRQDGYTLSPPTSIEWDN